MTAKPSSTHHSGERKAASVQQAINLRAVGVILASVLLAAAGQLLFKAALNQIGHLQLSIGGFITLITNPTMLLGLAIFGVSALLWLIALMKAELSFAYPFLSLSYIIILLGGVVLFNERVTLARLAGFVLIIMGLFAVARGEQREQL